MSRTAWVGGSACEDHWDMCAVVADGGESWQRVEGVLVPVTILRQC